MSARALALPVPGDFLLRRDCCSYGYFLLEPNHWLVREQAFVTTLDLGPELGDARRSAVVSVRVTQPGPRPRGKPLRVEPDRALGRAERDLLGGALGRMLRLDEGRDLIRAFHKADAACARSGRGRLMRSPSLFEDVIKTVTSCNVAWPSTITMNRRLCEMVGAESASGRRAFPSAHRLARMTPMSLRTRCRVGYRDARIVELSRMFASGEVVPSELESAGTSDEQVHERLLEWPGIGPYAAANIMQLLGRYARLPLDTESVRHGRDILGYKGTPGQIMKRVKAHYAPMGEHAFRAYWFEVWGFYERTRGPAWTWDRETTGKTFTASKLANEPVPTSPRPSRS